MERMFTEQNYVTTKERPALRCSIDNTNVTTKECPASHCSVDKTISRQRNVLHCVVPSADGRLQAASECGHEEGVHKRVGQ